MRYVFHCLMMLSLVFTVSAWGRGNCSRLNGTWHGVMNHHGGEVLHVVQLTIRGTGLNKYANLQYIDSHGHKRASHQLYGFCSGQNYVRFQNKEWLSSERLLIRKHSTSRIKIKYDGSYVFGIQSDRVQSNLVKH